MSDPFVAKPVDLNAGVSTPDAPAGINPSLAGPSKLDAQPTGNLNKFKKGLLIFLLLAIPLSVFITANYKTIFKQRAAGCTDYGATYPENSGRDYDVKPLAYLRGYVWNNCPEPHTLTMNTFWCNDDMNQTPPAGCGDNLRHQVLVVPANTPLPGIAYSLEQAVPDGGACGSSQIDVAFEDIASWSNPEDQWHIGFFARGTQDCHSVCFENTCSTKPVSLSGSACTNLGSTEECTPRALKCDSVTLNPISTVINTVSEARTLTASASGGSSPYTFAWTTTGGALSPGTTKNSNLWTAPATLPTTATTWTITTTVTDTAPTGATPATATCTTPLTYTPASTPQTYQYKTCENNACATKPCSPTTTDCSGSSTCTQNSDCSTTTVTHKICQNNACVSVNGSGSDQCSSDAACAPAATPPPVPPAGNSMPTILGIGAGVIISIIGVMLAL